MKTITVLLIVCACRLSTTNARVSKIYDIFRLLYGEANQADDDIPEVCRDLTYCTVKPKNYPEEMFNKMFNGYKGSIPSVHMEIANRFSDVNEKDDCNSNVTFDTIYNVKDQEGIWQTVIQAPNTYFIQRIRLEKCTNKGAVCFKDFAASDNVLPTCHQMYNKWELLVYKHGKKEKIPVKLPICCACRYLDITLL